MEDIIDFVEEPKPEYGWRKWIAGMFDAVLVLALCFLWYSFGMDSSVNMLPKTLPFELVVFVLFMLYRFVTIIILRKTIGMFIFRIRFLNARFHAITMAERVSAAFFVMINGTDYYNEH